MNPYCRIMNCLPLFLIVEITSCQSCINESTIIPGSNNTQKTTIEDIPHSDDFCDYFYSKDTLTDTLHFNFDDKVEDFGPVYLSDNELEQIYCEIKRGNTNAYDVLCDYYFYSYSQYLPKSEMDKLICITDFLSQKKSYYRGYLACGNFIFDYLKFHVDDYYTNIMITYYEKYYEFSRSKSIAIKLHEIYSGKYSFYGKNTVKANYYEQFITDK